MASSVIFISTNLGSQQTTFFINITDFDKTKMTDLDPFIVQVFGAPPPGLDVYESSQIRNYTIISVSLALAALATLARWIARTISGARLQADDYILIFAAFVRSFSLLQKKVS